MMVIIIQNIIGQGSLFLAMHTTLVVVLMHNQKLCARTMTIYGMEDVYQVKITFQPWVSWATNVCLSCQLRAKRVLLHFKCVLLRTRRVLLLYKVHDESAGSQWNSFELQ